MVPGELDNDKVIGRKPQLNFPDVFNQVLGVPEVLLPILRYVVLAEGARENILRVASVSHLWREVVCEILKTNGVVVYELDGDKQVMADWDKYFVPARIPLGYLLPVGLEITEIQLFQPEIQQFVRRHSERVIKLKLTIYQSDLRLLLILDTFKLNNLVSLELSLPRCRLIWPEDSVRIVQSVMKSSYKLKDLSLRLSHVPNVNISKHSPASRWHRQALGTKLESQLVGECSNWPLQKLRISIEAMGWNPVFDWILKLSAPAIRELDIRTGWWSENTILLPETLVFPNLTTLRLVEVRHDDGTVSFDLPRRFPTLKFLHISKDRFASTTIFDQFFPPHETKLISTLVQVFTYMKADLSVSQCSRLLTGLPNCIRLRIEWYNADCANRCIRQITRNMTQLKILEVYLSGYSINEIAEHIDDWTFAGLESDPKVPKLERITIHALYPEALTRNIIRNVPTRIPTLMSLQILEKVKFQPEHGVDCRCPECKGEHEMYEEYKSNSAL